MLTVMDEITTLQAEVLRTLANPRRLEILHRLVLGPCEVRRLAEDLGASQPNISQHLAVLRSAGIVDAERDGREVRYRLTDPDVMVACGLMRQRAAAAPHPARPAVHHGRGEQRAGRDPVARKQGTTRGREPEPGGLLGH